MYYLIITIQNRVLFSGNFLRFGAGLKIILFVHFINIKHRKAFAQKYNFFYTYLAKTNKNLIYYNIYFLLFLKNAYLKKQQVKLLQN